MRFHLALIINVITAAILFVCQPWLVDFVYKIYSINEDANSAKEIIRIINRPFINDTYAQLSTILPTDAEINHILDVKQLININLAIFVLSAVALVMTPIPPVFSFLAKKFFLLSLGIILLLVNFWEQFFILFHQVLFPQGNWAFPSDSVLITLYPERFWLTTFITLSGILVATVFSLMALDCWLRGARHSTLV